MEAVANGSEWVSELMCQHREELVFMGVCCLQLIHRNRLFGDIIHGQ
jgi:hypothetical protein